MKYAIKPLLAFSLIAASTLVNADSVNAPLNISAKFVGTCQLSANALSFGTTIPSPITSNVPATGAIIATCSNNTQYTIALNFGSTTGATCAARKMAAGTNTINYNLFQDSTYSTIWGDGSGASCQSKTGLGSGAAQSIAVYGLIPGTPTQTPVKDQVYTDMVTVTMTF